ncbi:MAG: hypothetical protein ACRDYA_07850 [Egibacteraceae bacterium]
MFLWWIGNLVLALVVIPVVLLLLKRVLQATIEIKRHTDTILERAVAVSGQLHAVPAFVKTSLLVKDVGGGVLRYGAAIDRIL